MRPSAADTALFLLATTPAAAWNHLSASGFREAVATDHTLVAFVEPSLASSAQLQVEWARLEALLGGHVASVDCSRDADLCDELDVASYPAIRLFRDGRVSRYRGARRAHDLAAFLRRSQRPALSVVDSTNATSFATVDDVVFIASCASTNSDADAHGLPARFASLARAHSDRYSFAVGPPAAVPAVTCYRRGDDEQHTLAGPELAAMASLDAFVRLCATPAVVELTRRSEPALLGAGKSLVHYLYRSDDERRAYAATVRALAKAYGAYLVFTTVDAREYGDDLAASLGLAAGAAAVPGSRLLLAVQNPASGDVFAYTGTAVKPADITAAVVERFLVDITQGRVKPWSGAVSSHDEL